MQITLPGVPPSLKKADKVGISSQIHQNHAQNSPRKHRPKRQYIIIGVRVSHIVVLRIHREESPAWVGKRPVELTVSRLAL